MKNTCIVLGFLFFFCLGLPAQNLGIPANLENLVKQLEEESNQNPNNPDVLKRIESFGLKAKRSDDSLAILLYCRLQSHYFHTAQRYREALNASLQGLELPQRLNVQIHFQLLLDVVSNFWNLGEYSKAVPFLIRGENLLSDTAVNGFSKAIFYNFMGQYHYNEYACDKALEFFLQGDSLLDLEPSFREIEFIWKQNFKSNIGLTLMDLRRFSEAESYFRQALTVSKAIKNQAAVGFALVNLVQASRLQYPDSSFAPTLMEALRLVEHDADVNLKVTVLRELAKEYFAQHQTDSLRAILPRLETAVEFYPNNQSKVKLLFLLAKFNRLLNPDKAMGYIDQALALNDSLSLHPSGKNLLQIERERNLSLKERDAKQFAELKSEQLRKNIRLTSFFLAAAIGFLIVLVGLLAALLQKDRRLRRSMKNLRWQISNSSSLNQQLQLSMQQKNLLLGAVAHDLRNLLVNVNQVSEMLINRDLDASPEFKERMIRLMERSSRLGMHTIEDLIEGVQPEGRQKLKLDQINPSNCLDFVVDLLAFKAEKKGILLQVQKEERAPNFAGDRDKLNRALINLLDNAIKFSPIDSTVHLSYASSPDYLVFRIMDLGNGIHRQKFSESQNPFDDEGQPGTLGEPSTGLGLFIVRKIADLHQGGFRLISVEGQGTTAELTVSLRLV